jgi:hypothetical protein
VSSIQVRYALNTLHVKLRRSSSRPHFDGDQRVPNMSVVFYDLVPTLPIYFVSFTDKSNTKSYLSSVVHRDSAREFSLLNHPL